MMVTVIPVEVVPRETIPKELVKALEGLEIRVQEEVYIYIYTREWVW